MASSDVSVRSDITGGQVVNRLNESVCVSAGGRCAAETLADNTSESLKMLKKS